MLYVTKEKKRKKQECASSTAVSMVSALGSSSQRDFIVSQKVEYWLLLSSTSH